MKRVERAKFFFKICFIFSLFMFLLLFHFYSNYKNYHHFFPSNLTLGTFGVTKPNFTSLENEVPEVQKLEIEIGEQVEDNETMSCIPPNLKPFDPSIIKFLGDPPPAPCSEKFPLLFTTDLDRTLIQNVKSIEENGYSSCCFTPFVRVDEENVKFDEVCTPIKEEKTAIPDNIEYIRITCYKYYFWPFHLDYLSFLPKVRPKVAKIGEKRAKTTRRPNIVILGLDATSHMNFQRNLPLAFEYLTKTLNARGMAGYNIIGENTLPNLVPTLTGLSLSELRELCFQDYHNNYFDNCPFIWKNYSSQGYLTAYAEDGISSGTFKYAKQGFFNKPTDYYHSTFFYHMEEKVGHGPLKWCYGSRLGFEILLNMLRQMAFVMSKESQPYFQLVWATSLFHSLLNAGKHGDRLLLNTLTWFKEQGYLDNTVFILMSDHGLRWGDIQSTIQGRIERRMPFLYFLFPPWFVKKYPRAVNNFERNKKRLTTHFDLHETLKDLLFLQNITDDRIKERQEQEKQLTRLSRGISLFLPISGRRTCTDAGIPEVWCICGLMKNVSIENNGMVRQAAENIVAEINKKFKKYPQCANLRLADVRSAQVSSQVEDQRVTYSISLFTYPGNALFEAVATRETSGAWTVSNEISRSNQYKGQSDCVQDFVLKLFCFCRV